MELEDGTKLKNLFVKEYKKIQDSVIELDVKMLCIVDRDKVKNW